MLITGASSGIGFETLAKCFENNIYPIAAIRDKKKLEKKLKERELSSNEYSVVRLDLEDIQSINSLPFEIKKITKKLDHLVLNAGFIETAPVLMTSRNSIEKHLNINFINQMCITQSIVRRFFIKQKKGTIVAVSSSAAIDANEARMAYASSKAALSTAIRVLSKELGKINIRANIIAPGLIETNLMNDSTNADQILKFIDDLSIRRLGKPSEVAEIIHFLSSDQSSFITGQVISIDGFDC